MRSQQPLSDAWTRASRSSLSSSSRRASCSSPSTTSLSFLYAKAENRKINIFFCTVGALFGRLAWVPLVLKSILELICRSFKISRSSAFLKLFRSCSTRASPSSRSSSLRRAMRSPVTSDRRSSSTRASLFLDFYRNPKYAQIRKFIFSETMIFL